MKLARESSGARKAAKASVDMRYFTGLPCRKGHVAERITSNGCCVECSRAQCSSWKQANASLAKASNDTWKTKNKDRVAARRREYNQANCIRIAQYAQARRKAKPEAIAAALKSWKKRNADAVRSYTREYRGRRQKDDPVFALAMRLRKRAANAYAGKAKPCKTVDLIGCSFEQFAAHIEAQFLDGMGWGNRSEWHIDHVRPIASFDLADEAQAKAAFHFTNCRPLWAMDNLRKGARITLSPQMVTV